MSNSDSLHVNHRYLLSWARDVSASVTGARILDFGCGAGEVVEAGREQGLSIYGADAWDSVWPEERKNNAREDLLGDAIRDIRQGQIPFPDQFFDLVTSNQVFEHCEDLPAVIHEVARVTKPGGVMLALFPSKGVFREGHIGIPFVHWYAAGSRLRRWWTLGLWRLGLGYHRGTKRGREWVDWHLSYLDRFVYYQGEKQILRALGQEFRVDRIEADYMWFRLASERRMPTISRLAAIPGIGLLVRGICVRLAGMVLLCTRRDTQPAS